MFLFNSFIFCKFNGLRKSRSHKVNTYFKETFSLALPSCFRFFDIIKSNKHYIIILIMMLQEYIDYFMESARMKVCFLVAEFALGY